MVKLTYCNKNDHVWGYVSLDLGLTALKSLAALWRWLTEPLKTVQKDEERRQSRLLSSLLLSILLTGIPLYWLLAAVDERFIVIPIGALVLPILYILSRRVSHIIVAGLFLVYGSSVLFVFAMVITGSYGLIFLYYEIAIVVFSSVFLSIRITLLIFVVYSAVMLVSPNFIAGVTLLDVVAGPSIFNVVLSAIIILTTLHRRQMEKDRLSAIQQSEARYRSLVENIRDMVYILSVDGGLLMVNAVTTVLTGWSREEMTGESIWTFVHTEDHSILKRLFRSDAEDATLPLFDIRFRTKAGGYIQLEFKPTPQYENGQLTGYLGIARDVTKRKQAEAERLKLLMEQDRLALMNRLVEAISHDFRNSLASIETSRHLVGRILPETERSRVQPKLDTIQTYVKRISEQLNNLNLVYSLREPHTEPCDLNQLVESLVANHLAEMQNKGLRLTFQPENGLHLVRLDIEKVSIGLKHLLANAMAHTPPGGQIRLRLYSDNERVKLDVSDNGRGIAPRHLPHIFDLFYRADTSRALESGGIGVGLTIVKMIVEAHGGTIDAQSEPTQGSTFTLSFPVAP